MVTNASGKGVSVLDFLCIAQTKDMMKSVLEHFVATNPSAQDKIKSVVIDKDYNEWHVLKEILSGSAVVLCQFYVLKWLKHALTMSRYGVPLSKREEAMETCREMVYASSDEVSSITFMNSTTSSERRVQTS